MKMRRLATVLVLFAFAQVGCRSLHTRRPEPPCAPPPVLIPTTPPVVVPAPSYSSPHPVLSSQDKTPSR